MRGWVWVSLIWVGCGDKSPGDDSDAACADPVVGFQDLDGDGFGADEVTGCLGQEGFVMEGGDCDDADPARSPEISEDSGGCDGLDNDCDAAIDEGQGTTWYADSDGDGQGDPETAQQTCAPPSWWVEDSRDCDDSDPTVGLRFEEVCDGVDNSCDGRVDEVPGRYGYVDADGDGYGDASTQDVCADAVDVSGDCDDSDAEVNPGAPEVCDDGRDDDCDGLLDCEDGDCLGDAACYERDCADGDDEDFDGLIDCFDEDCWETGCGVLEVAVLEGGDLSVDVYNYSLWDADSWRYTSSQGGQASSASENIAQTVRHMRLSVEDIRGFARWRMASGTTTCSWTVDALRWQDSASAWSRYGQVQGQPFSSSRSTSYAVGPTRSGFQLSSACPVEATSGEILPMAFRSPAYAGRPQPIRALDGVRWYEPATTWIVTTSDGNTYTAGVSDIRYFRAAALSYNAGSGTSFTSASGGYFWDWFQLSTQYSRMQLNVPSVWGGETHSEVWEP